MFGRTHKRLLERESRCQQLRIQRDEARRDRENLRSDNKGLKERIRRLEQDMATRSLNSGPSLTHAARMEARRLLAARYLQGQGLEIGALHCPVPVPEGVKVVYADYKSREESIRKHPELDASKIVPVDLIMNGETLDEIPGESLDFVIANHMLEHCEDFVRVLKNFYRVLKWDGVLFISLPDKRYTFDYRRPLTPHAHIVQDHVKGPLAGRYEHYVEFHTLAFPTPVEELESEAAVMAQPHLDIHFHVWDQAGMIRLFNELRADFDLAYEIEAYLKNGIEGIFILRKTLVAENDRSKP